LVCVLHFSRTFLGKNAHFQNISAKKGNDFRQLKRSNFRVEKCKTEENLSKFLNNMAYKTVTYMRDCVIKRNKSCVKSCKKTLLLKKHIVFPEKPIVFPKNPLFSNMCTILSHCFETKNYHCKECFLTVLYRTIYSKIQQSTVKSAFKDHKNMFFITGFSYKLIVN